VTRGSGRPDAGALRPGERRRGALAATGANLGEDPAADEALVPPHLLYERDKGREVGITIDVRR